MTPAQVQMQAPFTHLVKNTSNTRCLLQDVLPLLLSNTDVYDARQAHPNSTGDI